MQNKNKKDKTTYLYKYYEVGYGTRLYSMLFHYNHDYIYYKILHMTKNHTLNK